MADEFRSVSVPALSHLIPLFERSDAPPTLVRAEDIREVRPEITTQHQGRGVSSQVLGPGTEVRLIDGTRYTHESAWRFLQRIMSAGITVDHDILSEYRDNAEPTIAGMEVA